MAQPLILIMVFLCFFGYLPFLALLNLSLFIVMKAVLPIRDPGSGVFLTPGSGIRNRFFPDPGSQTLIFESLVTIFLGKKFYNSLKNAPNFFLQHFTNNIVFNFVKFMAPKKRYDNKFLFFSPLSFIAVFGSVLDLEEEGAGRVCGRPH
jgi:hypothetical protein